MAAQQTNLTITGMHCDACVRRVRLALEKLPSVQVSSVAVGSARINSDPALTSEQQILAAIDKIGFHAEASR